MKKNPPVDPLEFLVASGARFEGLSSNQEVYEFAARQLRLASGARIVTLASFDDTDSTMTCQALDAEPEILARLAAYPVGSPIGMRVPLNDPEALENLASGKVVYVPSLHDIMKGSWSHDVCGKVEAHLELGDILARGFTWNGRLLGDCVILMPRRGRLTSSLLVDALLRQTAIALQRRRAEAALRESEAGYRALAENTADVLIRIDPGMHYRYVNPAISLFSNLTPEAMLGKKIGESGVLPRKAATLVRRNAKEVFRTGRPRKTQFELPGPKGTFTLDFTLYPEKGHDGTTLFVLAAARDVSHILRTEAQLKDKERELTERNALLEQKNLALRELMQQVSAEKQRLSENVADNVRTTLLPMLDTLRLRCGPESGPQLELLRSSLLDLAAPAGRLPEQAGQRLSPRETTICQMIRHGLTSKEIGRSMGLSHRTVETYRNRIRRKLGLLGGRGNLASFLGHGQ